MLTTLVEYNQCFVKRRIKRKENSQRMESFEEIDIKAKNVPCCDLLSPLGSSRLMRADKGGGKSGKYLDNR